MQIMMIFYWLLISRLQVMGAANRSTSNSMRDRSKKMLPQENSKVCFCIRILLLKIKKRFARWYLALHLFPHQLVTSCLGKGNCLVHLVRDWIEIAWLLSILNSDKLVKNGGCCIGFSWIGKFCALWMNEWKSIYSGLFTVTMNVQGRLCKCQIESTPKPLPE